MTRRKRRNGAAIANNPPVAPFALSSRRCACGAAAEPRGWLCRKCRARRQWNRRQTARAADRFAVTDSPEGGDLRWL